MQSSRFAIIATMSVATSVALSFVSVVQPAAAAESASAKKSGVEQQYFDPAIRIQDDAFRAVNGKWLDTVAIPADESRWGVTAALRANAELQLRALIEADVAAPDLPVNTPRQQVADLYASFMNEEQIESLGLQPLAAELAHIASVKTKDDVISLIGHLNGISVHTPVSLSVAADARMPDRYAVQLGQGRLGLPDRDYYLDQNDQRFADIRENYLAHVGRLFQLAGEAPDQANSDAQTVLDFETALAHIQTPRVELRDPIKTYNKFTVDRLAELSPGINWERFAEASGYADKTDYVVISTPGYYSAFGKLLQATPLRNLTVYLRWCLLDTFEGDLGTAFAEEDFSFNGKLLAGTLEIQPPWKRGVALVNDKIREAIGQEYVQKYFSADRKTRIERMVDNLLKAYRASIKTLDWMGPETKREAIKKLDAINVKIGYPSKWIDYSSLSVRKDDLIGNVMRANQFEYFRAIDRLGKPIDRSLWSMAPQTVNAYFSPRQNDIVFPAAILQAPLFDSDAEDAINYGGIGAIIGHEISHAFDDAGSRYDEQGGLRNWWTDEDRTRFSEKTRRLIAQYDTFVPVPGYHLNGALTLGENIADNAGLAIAWKAYLISLAKQKPVVLDGYSAAQRFYIGYAQAWRGKIRDDKEIVYIKSDPHSPNDARVNGALKNQPTFDQAFHLKPGDGLYLAPAERVVIW